MPGRGRAHPVPRGSGIAWAAWLVRFVLGAGAGVIVWMLLSGVANAVAPATTSVPDDVPGAAQAEDSQRKAHAATTDAKQAAEEAGDRAGDTLRSTAPEVDVPETGAAPVDDAAESVEQTADDATSDASRALENDDGSEDQQRTEGQADDRSQRLIAHSRPQPAGGAEPAPATLPGPSTLDSQSAAVELAETPPDDGAAGPINPPTGTPVVHDGLTASGPGGAEPVALIGVAGLAGFLLLPPPVRRSATTRSRSNDPVVSPD